ncbi:hypothetical protein HNR71_006054 [Kribbella sandramycini]|uniref:Uncharacterized protein n=1 Tax=Kribbella sandramycini TaxID=60450 RepID=A0A841SII0_9ACTN|nr:hypothetical protein [Kribbella sandramycini]
MTTTIEVLLTKPVADVAARFQQQTGRRWGSSRFRS